MPAVILCLGDSHTRGFYGSDWVSMLERELGGSSHAKLVRKGVDGQLARNIEKRAPAALAEASSAAAAAGAGAGAALSGVVLFCGTNDALSCSPDWKQFHERTTKHVAPGEDVSPDTFAASVRRMLALVKEHALASAAAAAGKGGGGPAPPPVALTASSGSNDDNSAATPAALIPVALVTLPPLDEHDLPQGPGNAVVREHNARLRQIAAEPQHRSWVTMIDLYAAFERSLQETPAPSSARAPPAPHAPAAMVRGGMAALARRWVLRQPWDGVADANGGRLLTDRIHLSDRAGRLLCEALLPWARGAVAAAGGVAAAQ